MRTVICLLVLLITFQFCFCQDAEPVKVVLPISLSENIPTFFFLELSGNNMLESNSEIARYYETLLKYAGKSDTINGEDYRVESFDESCRFKVSFDFSDNGERNYYCFPMTPGVHVVLFESGDVGMIYTEPFGNQ